MFGFNRSVLSLIHVSDNDVGNLTSCSNVIHSKDYAEARGISTLPASRGDAARRQLARARILYLPSPGRRSSQNSDHHNCADCPTQRELCYVGSSSRVRVFIREWKRS